MRVRKGGVKGLSSRAEVREKVRGEYGFSTLMKQNKKAKILKMADIQDIHLGL